MTPREDPPNARERMLRRLRVYFAHRRWPRLIMSAVLGLTGLVGFFVSYLMLNAGLVKMSMRYPLATLLAWLVFLGLMRLWAEFERRALPRESDPVTLFTGDDPAENAPRSSDHTTLGEWIDVGCNVDSFGFDSDEGCLFGFVLFLLIGLLLFSFAALMTILVGAPVLIAEVFLDTILVAALYKRVRNLERRWWVATVLRQT